MHNLRQSIRNSGLACDNQKNFNQSGGEYEILIRGRGEIKEEVLLFLQLLGEVSIKSTEPTTFLQR